MQGGAVSVAQWLWISGLAGFLLVPMAGLFLVTLAYLRGTGVVLSLRWIFFVGMGTQVPIAIGVATLGPLFALATGFQFAVLGGLLQRELRLSACFLELTPFRQLLRIALDRLGIEARCYPERIVLPGRGVELAVRQRIFGAEARPEGRRDPQLLAAIRREINAELLARRLPLCENAPTICAASGLIPLVWATSFAWVAAALAR